MKTIYNLKSNTSHYRKNNYKSDEYLSGTIDFIAGIINLRLLGKEPLSILDVGCGAGGCIEAINGKLIGKIIYTGVDSSSQQIEHARNDLKNEQNYKFMLGDVEKLEFEENLYDMVFEIRMFQFLENPFAALNEMIRVSNGLIFCTVFTADRPVRSFHPMYIKIQIDENNDVLPDKTLKECNITEIFTHLLVETKKENIFSYPYCRQKKFTPSHEQLEEFLDNFDGKVLYHNKKKWELANVYSDDTDSGFAKREDVLERLNTTMNTLLLKKRC